MVTGMMLWQDHWSRGGLNHANCLLCKYTALLVLCVIAADVPALLSACRAAAPMSSTAFSLNICRRFSMTTVSKLHLNSFCHSLLHALFYTACRALAVLRRAGCDVQLHSVPNKGHSMVNSAGEMRACMAFWAARLRLRPAQADESFVEVPKQAAAAVLESIQ
jgi:hypothetical protein